MNRFNVIFFLKGEQVASILRRGVYSPKLKIHGILIRIQNLTSADAYCWKFHDANFFLLWMREIAYLEKKSSFMSCNMTSSFLESAGHLFPTQQHANFAVSISVSFLSSSSSLKWNSVWWADACRFLAQASLMRCKFVSTCASGQRD